MSATRPQPIISGAPSSQIAFADLPVASTTLSSASSVPSTGASSITARLWTLVSKPEGSTASIANSTSASCQVINIDLPGTYIVHLKVTDNLGRISLDAPYAKQNTGTYLIEEPETTSTVEIQVQAENTALVMPGAYGRGYADTLNRWLKEVDRLSPLNGVPMRGCWVQAHDGSAHADGSPARPFNPNSAAAEGFTGPIDQAVNYLLGLDITDNPSSGVTLFLLGGEYAENIVVADTATPWQILCLGQVYFPDAGNYIRYTVAAGDPTVPPNLLIGRVGMGAFLHSGQLQVGDSGAGVSWSLVVEDAMIGAAVVTGTLASGLRLYFRRTTFIDTPGVVLPNASGKEIEFSRFMYGISCKYIDRAVKSIFASVTVTQTSGADDSGFLDCGWEGTPTFTGPSGTATFDLITAARFYADGGSFSGGAGLSDALPVGNLRYTKSSGDFRIETTNGTMTLATGGTTKSINIQSTGVFGVTGGTGISLETSSGPVDIAAVGSSQALNAKAAGDLVATAGTGTGALSTARVLARGGSGADADLGADIIGPDSNNAGLIVRGRGTHTADLKVNEVREDTANAGVTIEDVLIKDGYVDAASVYVGGGSGDLASWYSLVDSILNALDSVYTRTVESDVVNLGTSAGAETTLLFTTAPNPAVGSKLIISAEYTGANNGNSKTYTLKIGATTLVTVTTSTTNDTVKLYAELTILGASSQIKRAYFQVNAGAITEYVADTTIDLGLGPNINFCGTTPTASNDVVLRQYHISIAPEGP